MARFFAFTIFVCLARTFLFSENVSPHRIEVSHIEPGGIGYSQGYTSVDFFFSEIFQQKIIPFLDVRGHVFNSGAPSFNTGMGTRFAASSLIFGGALYYDYRKTSRTSYNQATLSLEALSLQRDIRINVYVPFGGKQTLEKSRREFAMPGANIEVGKAFEVADFLGLYGAVSAYYFAKEGRHAMGGALRGSIALFEYVRILGFASYDPVFKGALQGELSFVWPFGKKRQIRNSAHRSDRNQERFEKCALQKLIRQEIIVVSATDLLRN